MSAPIRRTQAERTAETRRRILDAVVQSIAEVGFQRTTATEIARRAGVTWGAVQHHFGAKGGILEAVLEDTFERFEARLGDIPADAKLARRVSLFVERAWEHFASPHFRSTFEILLHYTGPEAPAPEQLWQSEMFRAWNRIWGELFESSGSSRRRTVTLQHYTISVLSGLAATGMLEGDPAPERATELGFLKDTLLRELSGASA